jgi:hypothetical protein
MNILSRHQCDGILQTGADIWNGQLGIIVLQDRLKGKAFVEKFQNALNRNPGAGHTGLAEVDFGIYRDSLVHLFTSRTGLIISYYTPGDAGRKAIRKKQ